MHTYNSEIIKVVNEPQYTLNETQIEIWEIVPGHCDRVQFKIDQTVVPPISELPGKKINVYDPASPTTLLYTWTVDQAYVRDDSVLGGDAATHDLIELWLVDDSNNPADLCFGGLGPLVGDPAPIKNSLVKLGFVDYLSLAYDSSNNRYVATYIDESNDYALTSVVGRKEGDSIVWGDPVAAKLYVGGEYNPHPITIYDPTAERIVLLYRDKNDGDKGKAIVGDINGSTINFGSPATFYNSSMEDCPFTATYDTTNNRIVACFSDDSARGSAVVIETVPDIDPSNNTINAGAPVQFDALVPIQWWSKHEIAACYDSANNAVVISYRDYSTSAGYTIAGNVTVPGNTIAFGSRILFEANSVMGVYSVFDSSNNNFTISYLQTSLNTVRTITGNITPPNTVNFPNPAQDIYSESAGIVEIPIIYDSNTNEIVLFSNGSNKAYIGDTTSGTPVFGAGTDLKGSSNTYRLNLVYNTSSNEILLGYIDSSSGDPTMTGSTFYTNTANKPTDFFLISQSIVPGVVGGWLKMRPYSHNPLIKADADKLFQGQGGVNIAKDITIVPDIDIEIKFVPSSIYVNPINPNGITWKDFDSVFVGANEEFSIDVPGLDIYDIYLRAIGTGTGYVKIVIVGVGYPF